MRSYFVALSTMALGCLENVAGGSSAAFVQPFGLTLSTRMHLRTSSYSSSMTSLQMVAVPDRPQVEVKKEKRTVPVRADPDPDVRQEYFGAAIGDTVRVNWVAKSTDGDVLGRSGASGVGGALKQCKFPSKLIREEFCLGGNEVHTAIHTALIGLLPGDSREVRLPAEECFGERNDDLIYTVTKDMLRPPVPADMPLRLGTTFKINKGMEARVTEVDGEWVVLDANCENAGKDLVFHLTVMDVVGSQCGNGIEELDFICDV